jgi:mono/diheme cytochrome c family protein
MRSRSLLLVLAGMFFLGVGACSVADTVPLPATPTTFFSALTPADTPFPTATALISPTDTPAASPADIARPSNPGGPGSAVGLTGDVAAGQTVFEANCIKCHAEEGKGGIANPGSDDGTVPPLNPIDDTLVSPDYQTYATNLDLFLEHGSTPSGSSPVLSMPNWGDSGKLTPQQIADVIAYVISLNSASVPAAAIARPSNPGGPGPAVELTGNVAAGKVVFEANCVKCHPGEGKGGIANPGSDDGTVPALNPIDETLVSTDYKAFATNLDLFLEHGSTPSGPSPVFSMPNWGDSGKLKPQQIADVIAYVISLNK